MARVVDQGDMQAMQVSQVPGDAGAGRVQTVDGNGMLRHGESLRRQW
jgi:hypothetical protein